MNKTSFSWFQGLQWTWEHFGWYGAVRYVQTSVVVRWQDNVAVPIGQAVLHLRAQWYKRQNGKQTKGA